MVTKAKPSLLSIFKTEEYAKTVNIDDMPLKDIWGIYEYIKVNGLKSEDKYLLENVVEQLRHVDNMLITVSIEKEVADVMTFGQLKNHYDTARTNYIVVHRVNYIAMDSIIMLQDLLGKRYRFTVKQFGEKCVAEYNKYMAVIRSGTEYSAYCVLQDHLRLTNEALQPKLEAVFIAIRDRMIGLGDNIRNHHAIKDIEILARTQICLYMLRIMKYSRTSFFREFDEQTGADFTKCFAYANLQKIEEYFLEMIRLLGIKTVKTDKGDYDLMGFGSESVRVTWAWDEMMKFLRDDEMMDATAKQAIDLNPTVAENYRKEIESVENREMEENFEKLQEKFKVNKQKKK